MLLFLSIQFIILFQLLLDHHFLLKPEGWTLRSLSLPGRSSLLWELQVFIVAQTLHGPAPLHMVQKPDGSWCPCSYYCCLNTMTVPDRYPLPNMANFNSRLNCWYVFTKFTKGYYQVLMAKGDISKTAVITPFGLFKWIRMPLG